MFLKIWENSQEKNSDWVSLLITLQALMFSCEFCEVFKNTFYYSQKNLPILKKSKNKKSNNIKTKFTSINNKNKVLVLRPSTNYSSNLLLTCLKNECDYRNIPCSMKCLIFVQLGNSRQNQGLDLHIYYNRPSQHLPAKS